MIDYPGQEQDRVEIPSVPDDILLFGQNVPNLAEIRDLLVKLVDADRRAESPNPSLIVLANGRDAAFTYQSTVRMRVTWVMIGNNTAATSIWGLKIGSMVVPVTMAVSGLPMVPVPYEIVLEPGVDVQLWDIANNNAADGTKMQAFLFAYPELETYQ